MPNVPLLPDVLFEPIPAGSPALACYRCGRPVFRAPVASPFPGDVTTNLRIDPDVPGGYPPTETTPGRGWVHVRVCRARKSAPESDA